ncbi:MAG: helix-turn-helix domain-containing protein [Gallionella sp.]|nr:helix-turn-helix domain-containing protein [Gallionella sp.]
MEYKIAIAHQLSSLLKSLRKQAGLTQQEMGARLGITQRRVAAIEASPESARFERILQILSELDADLVIRERPSESGKGNKGTW